MEFLLLVLLSLILISIFTGSILSLTVPISNQILSASSIATAVSSSLNNGIQASFDQYFSIEQDRLHIRNGSKLIEVGGIFEYDPCEPI
jgi:uncharacterized membrane protein